MILLGARRSLWIALAGASLSIAACKSDKCKEEPPGFQLTFDTVELTHASEVKSLVVDLTLSGTRLQKTFDVGDALQDTRTSIAVRVDDPAPTAPFSVDVHVTANTDVGGGGAVVGEASDRLQATADGCNKLTMTLTPVALPPVDAGPRDGAPVDGEIDGGVGDAALDAGDAQNRPDGQVDAGLDATPGDTGADTGVQDTGIVIDAGPACAQPPDPSTVALYHFEGDVTDETGAHNGSLEGNNTSFGAGPTDCGDALYFANGGGIQGWGRVEDSPDFDLVTGSVDLWVKINDSPPLGASTGIVSRDAFAAVLPGHFTLFLSCEGRLVAKIETGGSLLLVCANQIITQNTWSHVGVNFGAPGSEIWVDGVLGTYAGNVTLGSNCGTGSTVACGTPTTQGLDGNDNPWIMGASSGAAPEGTGDGTQLTMPFRHGAIDSFRISSVRRAF